MVLQDERVSNKIGMFLMDHQMRIIHVDPVAAELLGWSKPQEMVGRRCWEVMHVRDTTGDNPCHQDCLPLQFLRGGRSAPKWVVSHMPSGGNPRWLSWCHFQGLDQLIVHMVHDVTEEQEALRLFSAVQSLLMPESGAPPEARKDGERILAHSLGLTPREVGVVSCLARGYVNSDIARELVLSDHTVNNHIRRILAKLDLHHRAEVVPYILRHIIASWAQYSASGATIKWLFSPKATAQEPESSNM